MTRIFRSFCAGLLLALSSSAAFGATFIVNNLADANDASPGNGVCDNGDGTCSFRAAVQEANALSGPDRIELVAGTHVLSLSSSFGLLKPSLQTEIDVVGAGAGQSVLFADVQAQNGMIDVLYRSGPIRISNLTFDVRTGQQAIIYSGSAPSAGTDGLLLEDVELLANSTVPSLCCGAVEVIDAAGTGAVVLRRAFVETKRTAANGFVIFARNTGGLLIEDSTFDGGNKYRIAVLQNVFTNQGGPITTRNSLFRNFGGPAGLFGAQDSVILLRPFDAPGAVTIERTTFESSNRAVNITNRGAQADLTITDSLFDGLGSAVAASGPAMVAITNSTVSGGGTGIALTAPDSGFGTVSMTLANVTITGASTSVSVAPATGTLTTRNSIIANGTTAECVGTLTSAGHNLIEGSCTIAGDTTGNIIGTDPMLGPLAENGGPTRTHALEPSSLAIDAGDDANCPTTDQRGFSRPADGDGDTTATCDIGAFEKNAVLVTNLPPTASDDIAAVDEDQSISISVAGNDTDPDGNLDPTTANTACATCSLPTSGLLTNNGDGTFDYTPAADFFGADSFVYQICDSDGACDTATVDITVNPVNDPPTFAAGADPDFPAGTSGPQSVENWPQNIDLGPNEVQQVDSYAVITTSDPDSILAGSAAISTSGELTFSLTGASGTAQLEAKLTDDGGIANGGNDTSAAVTFSITVRPPEADMVFAIMRCSQKAAPGEFYPYGFLVENRGPDAAEGVALTHTPIAGATVISISSPDCVENVNTVDCDFGTLAPGQNVPVGLRIVAPTVGAQVLPMTINGASDTVDPNLGNNDVGATVEIVPDLVIADGFEACGPCGFKACSR